MTEPTNTPGSSRALDAEERERLAKLADDQVAFFDHDAREGEDFCTLDGLSEYSRQVGRQQAYESRRRAADWRTIASILRVQPSHQQQPGWLPIESAPTDRAIMMYDVAFGVYDIGRLWSPETMPQPTHWMPLPAAPTDRRVTEETKP